MKNANLYEILKEYGKAATTLLKERIKEVDLPLENAAWLTEFGPGGEFIKDERKINWWPVVYANERVLERLDAYQHALQAMMDDQTIAKHFNTLVGIPTVGRRIEGTECLRWFVHYLLDKQQGFDFQENRFQQIYEDLEDFFYRDIFEFRIVCPLHFFEMQVERVDLSPKFSIIKLSVEEKEGLRVRSDPYVTFPHLNLYKEFALEIYAEAPKIIGELDRGNLPREIAEKDPLSVARRAFDDACGALRLFKNGAVFYSEYWMEPTSWNVIGRTRARPGPGPHGFLYGPPYTLLDDEVPIFSEFWKSRLKDRMEKHESIMIAFNRLNFGYERLRPEDRLIDFMIGLEALCLDDMAELSYRLSLRVAGLLGGTTEKRERIFTELRKAYGQRSKIAHGKGPDKDNNIDGTKIPFGELVNRVEEHLRSAIKEFLVRAERHSKEQVLDKLDLAIVRGFSTTN